MHTCHTYEHVRNPVDKAGSVFGGCGKQRVSICCFALLSKNGARQKWRLSENFRVVRRIFELSGGFSSCPEELEVVLLDHFLTLFLCSFWYKSTGIKKKWSQFRIIHFLKRLFGAIWLFETRFRAWNNFYMDHSTDTPTHPSTQYRNALGIRSRTTSRITRTTSYMHLESVSSSLWRNSVTSENQFKPVPATPKKAAGFVFAFLTCSS